MLIFVDESGIHKKTGKSSVALVYVMVEDIENVEKAILKAEKVLRITSFHWPRHIWKIRFNFIKMLIKENFTVEAAIIRNPFSENSFERTIEHLLIEKKVKKIILDGKKPKWYALRLKKVLRDRGISVKKIRTGNDESFPCLRLADAYAGLIRTYWDDKKNQKAKELYELANNKITTQLVGGQDTG
ncbi:DUF3800 domain-containing protein [Patescibacteria group bacterium]|nr:DUF3800 domain-containing protein [Patescibacteria group bacterium]